MSDYISREAANIAIQKKMQEYINKSVQPLGFGKYREDDLFTNVALGCRAALEEVKVIPAADVRPVVRGEWEHTEDFDEYGGGRYVEWTCSECFFKVKGDRAVRDSHIDEKPRENFCPNCGADMREKQT